MKIKMNLVGIAMIFGFFMPALMTCPQAADSTVMVGELAPDAIQCPAKIEWEIGPGARLLTFACELSSEAGKPLLIYRIRLRNIGDHPHRYQVKIDFLQGQPLLMTIPQSADEPPLPAGQSAGIVYHVPGRDHPPEVMAIRIAARP